MMGEQASRFEALRQLDDKLAQYACTAERLVTDPDPGPCLNSLRKFGERMAKLVSRRNGIRTKIDDGFRIRNKKTAELLEELKSCLSQDMVEHFYTVNNRGNTGSHDDDGRTPGIANH